MNDIHHSCIFISMISLLHDFNKNKSKLNNTYLQDTVDVDLEGDLNLWHTSGCWWDSREVEFSEQMVIFSHWSLSLEYLDCYGGLVISGSGEDLRFLCWDHSVTCIINKKTDVRYIYYQ